MPEYRIAELDLSTRYKLGLETLRPIPKRPWGRATELAKTCSIFRAFVYQLRDRAQEALKEALAPRKPGPQSQEKLLMMDKAFLRRSIRDRLAVLDWPRARLSFCLLRCQRLSWL